MWTILHYAILLAVGVILAVPAMVIVIPLGKLLSFAMNTLADRLGVVLSLLLTPLFHVPSLIRGAGVFILVPWILWRYPLSIFAYVYGGSILVTCFMFYAHLAHRYHSMQGWALLILGSTFLADLFFELSGRLTGVIFFRVIITLMIAPVPTYLLTSMYRAFVTKTHQQAQSRRHAYARKIYRLIYQGKGAPSYCLYLRAFVLDREFGPPLANWDVNGWGLGPSLDVRWGANYDSREGRRKGGDISLNFLEDVLIRSIRRKLGALVAVGQPDKSFGAGRVEATDENWRTVVADLMEHANIIFVAPADRRGTIWEIVHLVRSGYLNKTVFIFDTDAGSGVSHRSWESARQILNGIIELPEAQDKAGFFMQKPTGEFAFAEACWTDGGVLASVFTRKSLLGLFETCHTPIDRRLRPLDGEEVSRIEA